MADNPQLPATGTGTADIIVRTDQDPTTLAHYQYVKLASGDEGVFLPFASAGEAGGLAVRLLVEDQRLRRVVEEFLVATTEQTTVDAFGEVSDRIATSHVAVSNQPSVLARANQGRRRITIVNYQTVTIYFGGSLLVATTNGIRLAPSASVPLRTQGEIWAATNSPYSP